MKRFEGRSILVTGGASGIGEATARAFAAEGGRVTIADLDESRGQEVAESIRSSGGTALFVKADATLEADNAAMVEGACRAHGPLRHAFNNVGLSRGEGLHELSLDDWDWSLRVSLTSTFLAMKHEIPIMLAHGGGTIVNTASMSGLIYTAAANAAYSAAKAGVIHLTRYASARHAGQGVRVNSVAPGLTATPVIAAFLSEARQAEVARAHQAIARAVRPEEVAAAVLFLSSDEAGMISGTNTEVSGGRR